MTRLIFPADIPPFPSLCLASPDRFVPSFVRLERSILGHETTRGEKRAKMQPCVARHTEWLNTRMKKPLRTLIVV